MTPSDLIEWHLSRADTADANGIQPDLAFHEQAAACIREMVEWRPIETAPRDGSEIIAMIARKRVRLAWYFKPSSRTEGWLDENGRAINPTHWLPSLQHQEQKHDR